MTTTPTPRPVPTQDDRMRDARTDHLDVANKREYPTSFATYLDRTERDQLDAKAACAEAERDEALDERDGLRAEINRVEQTRQEQVQALNAKLQDALWTAGQHATTAASLRQQLDQATAERDQARRLAALTAEQEAANAQIIVDTRAERDRVRDRLAETRFRLTRTEQELGAAGDVLAVVRDAAERIDRALATYDTTPSEEPGQQDVEQPEDLRSPLAAERDKLVETIGRLVSLPPEQIAQMHEVGYSGTTAALGSLPPRAQDEPDSDARRLLDQAIATALPLAGGRVEELLDALRCELARVDAKRAEREG